MSQPNPVSLIVTVLNEANTIIDLLDTLENQTRPPDEVVIVDGGSTDGTPALIAVWAQNHVLPVHCLLLPGANISQGRNFAIRHARYSLIAATDAGVRLLPDWLELLVKPFETGGVGVVSGFFRSNPAPGSPFQIAMGATVLPAPQEVDPAKFLPSSRSVAFTCAAWQAAGGYPEWLDYCEDLIFDLNLKATNQKFYFQPAAVALFAPRQNLKQFLPSITATRGVMAKPICF